MPMYSPALTGKLRILPLFEHQVQMLIEEPKNFYVQMGLIYEDHRRDFSFDMLLRRQYQKLVDHPESSLFHTIWLLIDQRRSCMVGYAYFCGPPCDGAVELIGFIKPQFRRKGYMTEAASTMRAWAFHRKDITKIISHRKCSDYIHWGLLQKLGFSQSPQTSNLPGVEIWYSEKEL